MEVAVVVEALMETVKRQNDVGEKRIPAGIRQASWLNGGRKKRGGTSQRIRP